MCLQQCFNGDFLKHRVSAHCHRTTLPKPPYFTACSSVLAAPTAPAQHLGSFINVFFGQRFGQRKTRACCAHLFPRPSLVQTVLLVSLQAHEEIDRAKVEGSNRLGEPQEERGNSDPSPSMPECDKDVR